MDFSKKAPKEFWKKFPYRRLPTKPSTRVNVKRLEAAVKKVDKKLTVHQNKKAKETIRNLKLHCPKREETFLSMERNATVKTFP